MMEAEIYRMLNAFSSCSIEWLLVVPASGLNSLYDYYQKRKRCLYVTREEEAVAIAAGLTLGGARPLIVMQQSGVGNSLNAVFSLADAYEIFFPILVFDRSEKDPNPVQRVSSKNTRLILENLGHAHIDWSEVNAGEKFKNLLDGQCRWVIATFEGRS